MMATEITARDMADTIRALPSLIEIARDTIHAIIAIAAIIVQTDGGMIHAGPGASVTMVMHDLLFNDQCSDPSRSAGQTSALSLFRE
ncbi:hypothetical protein Brsp01_07150 [Brucella sp. NBRC 12950]|nr:hypothetical protein Brsp01_07150 [Brucella sp. NBRC 12950]